MCCTYAIYIIIERVQRKPNKYKTYDFIITIRIKSN